MQRATQSLLRLQWGRAYKSAELLPPEIFWPWESCFNGAALTRARSFTATPNTAKLMRLLQWGRAYKSAELSAAGSDPPPAFQLQWGRAYKSAEFADFFSTFLCPFWLQWGRAYKSAEFWRGKPTDIWQPAASMGPRLQERGVMHRHSQSNTGRNQLQWGRAYKSAELPEVVAPAVVKMLASMGPRLQERGVASRPSGSSNALRSFNGAALTRARS